jgi:mRNA-degrading endonuclease toxin of MazEF toxin-antitoxin module
MSQRFEGSRPHRGDIWLADLTTVAEATFGSSRKLRPVVVLAIVDYAEGRGCRAIVVPSTTVDSAHVPGARRIETRNRNTGQMHASWAVASSVTSIDRPAMRHFLGRLARPDVDALGVTVALLARDLTDRIVQPGRAAA